jgi:hypothetical protein
VCVCWKAVRPRRLAGGWRGRALVLFVIRSILELEVVGWNS